MYKINAPNFFGDQSLAQQLAAELIPWFHYCIIIDKVSNSAQRLSYIQKTIEQSCFRNILGAVN
jgi:hypothetical protein